MASELAALLDAVVADLEDGTFTLTISPERSYGDWEEELTELDTLRVDVVPESFVSTALVARKTVEYAAVVLVAVRKRFGTSDQDNTTGRVANSSVDALVELTEDIYEYLVRDGATPLRPPDVSTKAALRDADVTPFVREHLRNMRQFTGFVRLTYELTKAINV